jgi:ring-1,2-phenylacetyl-CoA epoxidase subunit PaaE
MTDLKHKITSPLKVAIKLQETEDAYSFQLDIPPDLKSKFAYQAGQFVTLFLEVNGQEISRSYSLSTSPTFDKNFQITVKRVKGGLGSNFLADHIESDDTLLVTPPQGTFFKPLSPGPATHYFLFAAGSGITPIFSIMKELLSTRSEEKIYLFYCNRSENDVIYKNQIETLKNQYPNRLSVTHMLSQPVASRLTLVGRCSALLVKNFVVENSEGALQRQAYMCGPEGFMDQVQQGLQLAGLTQEEIRKESFGVTIVPAAPSQGASFDLSAKFVIGDATAPLATPKKLIATLGGETVEVDLNPDLSILENLIEAGQNPPYSCMNGACMACMGKVKQGRVYQDDPGILTEENMAAGETLTCQARALTETVKIDYDDF